MKLYTKTVCPKCMLVKQVLNSAGVAYEEVNVEFDEVSLTEIKEKGFMAVPIVKYDGKYIADFKEIQSLISELVDEQ